MVSYNMHKFNILESCSHAWNENVNRDYCVKVVSVAVAFFSAMFGCYKVYIDDGASYLNNNPQYKNTWFGIALEKRNIVKFSVTKSIGNDSVLESTQTNKTNKNDVRRNESSDTGDAKGSETHTPQLGTPPLSSQKTLSDTITKPVSSDRTKDDMNENDKFFYDTICGSLLNNYQNAVDNIDMHVAAEKLNGNNVESVRDVYLLNGITFPLWETLSKSIAREFDLPDAEAVQRIFDKKITVDGVSYSLRVQEGIKWSYRYDLKLKEDMYTFISTLFYLGQLMKEKKETPDNLYLRTYKALINNKNIPIINNYYSLHSEDSILLDHKMYMNNHFYGKHYELLEEFILNKK